MKRTYVKQADGSKKFWTIELADNSLTIAWGRLGTHGRTTSKLFENSEMSRNEAEKLIKEKLGKGYHEIDDLSQIQYKLDETNKPMSEDVFWEIIQSFNWAKTGNDKAVLRPAVRRLASMRVEDINKFADILSEKLFLLDSITYASNIGEDSYGGEDEYFSVDNFLYVRCCVVANGKAYFNQVKADPAKMPKGIDFEPLLHLPADAYKEKTKSEDYNYEPKFGVETFSNAEGWKYNDEKRWWKFW